MCVCALTSEILNFCGGRGSVSAKCFALALLFWECDWVKSDCVNRDYLGSDCVRGDCALQEAKSVVASGEW